ncbi:MAG: twin-arginine translocase TatA/TatE family subunit [Pedobacter sp.]|uniref:Sec-independent protein translocase subunit TatA/TatB n=1 Tax=Pedobacter sp. TaxID=1411316 RepID=UPI0028070807|nr:twin-arginine translocase TatA/TatE family subunit [Pedobacter sp.]MDQ8004277.1 twin-arginine translocase TatA/TatE family subunit [Pedobacter sp.]
MYNTPLLEFLNMGGGEMIIIMIAVLLLFGGKKLPELARGLGKGIREFKDASEGVKREIHRNINSFDVDEEDRKADENRRYREPEEDHSHSIHDDAPEQAASENQNETSTVDTKEDKESKSSV